MSKVMVKIIHLGLRKSASEMKIDALRNSIWRRTMKHAKAIGAWQAASDLAIMSSVMIAGRERAGQPKTVPQTSYDDLIRRFGGQLTRTNSPDADALRRSLWKRILKLAARTDEGATANDLAMQSSILIEAYRDQGRLKPGPKVYYKDFVREFDDIVSP